MLETQVRFLGQEDPLEKEMATHSSTLAWKIPWTGAWWASVHGATESDTTERLHFHFSVWLTGCYGEGDITTSRRRNFPTWRSESLANNFSQLCFCVGFPDSSVGKESACNAGDPGSIPVLGRSWRQARLPTPVFLGFPVAQLVKNPPAMFLCYHPHPWSEWWRK